MISENQAKKYCKEDISKIENYDKAISDTTQIWHCHHRTEIWWNCSIKELKENKCYYHRKACELIFLTNAEHARLHKKGRHGHKCSEETKKKISESNKGKTSSFKGHNHSEETKRKISVALKGQQRTLGLSYPSTEFGKAYQEHFKVRACDNKKQYDKEKHFWYKFGKFSWEVE